jgi:hypothetical protein
MAVSDDALQQNEGSRAARPEPLPFLLFMCPVDTTSATHQAHKFSSLLPHIDLTTASSKEPMNRNATGLDGFSVPLLLATHHHAKGACGLTSAQGAYCLTKESYP